MKTPPVSQPESVRRQSLPEVWFAIGHGEGGAEMRVVRNDAEMVQWLWEQCGHDYTGNEEHARNTWFAYLEDGDNWRRLDEVPRWWCKIDVGETGHIEFIRLLDDVAGRVADNDRLLQQLKSSEAREAALENEVNMLRGQRNDAERRIAAITEGAGCGP